MSERRPQSLSCSAAYDHDYANCQCECHPGTLPGHLGPEGWEDKTVSLIIQTKSITKRLDWKIAVITGGSTGIGLATAQWFLDEGACVFINGRPQKRTRWIVIRKLVDGKGRIARKLRISVTDKCNFACLFCMPNKKEVNWIPQQDILSFEEIIRIAKVLCSLGIVKVRITGGPLSGIDKLNTVDMTTNGWFLVEKVKEELGYTDLL